MAVILRMRRRPPPEFIGLPMTLRRLRRLRWRSTPKGASRGSPNRRRQPPTRPPRPRDRAAPTRRDHGVDRADGIRGVLGGPGVEALVRELLDPGLLGVRGEPADAE